MGAQALKPGALPRRDVDAGMQGESAGPCRTVGIDQPLERSGWRRLPREQLLPSYRADRDAVGDREAEQVVERTASGSQAGSIGLLGAHVVGRADRFG
jgi:hypothetical protein